VHVKGSSYLPTIGAACCIDEPVVRSEILSYAYKREIKTQDVK
jgi:hypothetical protein